MLCIHIRLVGRIKHQHQAKGRRVSRIHGQQHSSIRCTHQDHSRDRRQSRYRSTNDRIRGSSIFQSEFAAMGYRIALLVRCKHTQCTRFHQHVPARRGLAHGSRQKRHIQEANEQTCLFRLQLHTSTECTSWVRRRGTLFYQYHHNQVLR